MNLTVQSVKIYDIKASANDNYSILRSIDRNAFYWNDAKFIENKVEDYVFVVNKVGREAMLTQLQVKAIDARYYARTNTSQFADGGQIFKVKGKFRRFIKFAIVERNHLSPDWNWTKRIGHSEIYDLWKENGKLIGDIKRLDKIKDLRRIFSGETAIKLLDDCTELLKGTPQGKYPTEEVLSPNVERHEKMEPVSPLSRAKPYTTEIPFQRFVDVADKQSIGKGTTGVKEFRETTTQIYYGLIVKMSFGIGRATSVPWMAFLGDKQKVSEGIYPVLLYYKELKLLILSYGVSETAPPKLKWPKEKTLTNIETYFASKGLGKPDKYGNSFVFKTYATGKKLDESVIEKNLDDLIEIYNSIFPPSPTTVHKTNISPILPHMAEKAEKSKSNLTESLNFWWLMTNPVVWDFNDLKESGLYNYNIRNENGNKRLKAENFEHLQKGDLILGYENSPIKQIKIIFTVEKPLHKIPKAIDVITLKVVEKLEYPIHWSEFKNEPGLDEAEFIKDHQSNLLKLTEHEYRILINIIDYKSIAQKKLDSSKERLFYSFNSDRSQPFISSETFKEIISLLQSKKNVILQGPPGVGKTYLSKKIAYHMIEYVYDNRVEMVQFHQSYGYEDFIQGLKPSPKGGFELKNGIFYTFCQKAMQKPDKPFIFIIDEINRGNLNKIFGELLMLIEKDKRGPEFSIRLANSEDESDKFYVPANVYILGTMNTADKSLATLDYALYRRFAFILLQSELGNRFQEYLKSCKISSRLIKHICDSITNLNNEISGDSELGKGFQIGHSYFCGYNKSQPEEEWWKHIIDYELKPILNEMWFDKPEHVANLVRGLNYKQ